jgi:uncharacterized protein (TIGR03089 family)
MTQDLTRTGLDELITYYDDATGERVGLTADELGDWTSATSALLTQGCGVRARSQAAVLLPPHWQTAVVLLGCWATGVEVSFRGWSTAGLSPAGAPLDVSFVEHRRIGSWLDDVPPAGYQFSLPLSAPAAPPPGYDDFTSAVAPWLGSAPPGGAVDARDRATVAGETYGQYGALAGGIAETRGIGRGDRVLVDAAASEQPLIWLLAPLSVGASIVLCANLDRARLDERVAAERVTRVLA